MVNLQILQTNIIQMFTFVSRSFELPGAHFDMTVILDDFALSTSVDGHLETFEEKKQELWDIK